MYIIYMKKSLTLFLHVYQPFPMGHGISLSLSLSSIYIYIRSLSLSLCMNAILSLSIDLSAFSHSHAISLSFSLSLPPMHERYPLPLCIHVGHAFLTKCTSLLFSVTTDYLTVADFDGHQLLFLLGDLLPNLLPTFLYLSRGRDPHILNKP